MGIFKLDHSVDELLIWMSSKNGAGEREKKGGMLGGRAGWKFRRWSSNRIPSLKFSILRQNQSQNMVKTQIPSSLKLFKNFEFWACPAILLLPFLEVLLPSTTSITLD